MSQYLRIHAPNERSYCTETTEKARKKLGKEIEDHNKNVAEYQAAKESKTTDLKTFHQRNSLKVLPVFVFCMVFTNGHCNCAIRYSTFQNSIKKIVTPNIVGFPISWRPSES